MALHADVALEVGVGALAYSHVEVYTHDVVWQQDRGQADTRAGRHHDDMGVRPRQAARAIATETRDKTLESPTARDEQLHPSAKVS